MHIEVNTVGVLGKSLSIKREKGEDDAEIVVAHLKFSDAIVPRETIDELVGMGIGWAESCLYNELGAPVARMEISLPKLSCEVTGTIKGNAKDDSITLAQATLDGVSLLLTDKGASMSGNLAWLVAGDEASDAEPLIGRLCSLHWVLQDAGQKDLLKDAA